MLGRFVPMSIRWLPYREPNEQKIKLEVSQAPPIPRGEEMAHYKASLGLAPPFNVFAKFWGPDCLFY